MPSLSEDMLEAGRKLFARECRFVTGVARLDQLPEGSLPEIAFAGRSNVGKSSLINALTGRRRLAHTSNTPGRTRQINFFDLGQRLMIVDLPGYGFAKAPKGEIARWTALIDAYLHGRAELRQVCLLIDSRHGVKPSDEDLMQRLDKAAVAFQIVLTKADKIAGAAAGQLRESVESILKEHPAARPEALPTSATKGTGMAEFRAHLAALVDGQALV